MSTNDQTSVLRSLTQTDPVQVTTRTRTLTGVVYQTDHHEPTLTCRGPEPGELVLCFTTPCHDCYRLQYTYYEECDHTKTVLDRYGRTPRGTYAWRRTHADVESVANPAEDGETA